MRYETRNQSWILTSGTDLKLLTTFSKHFNLSYTLIDCQQEWELYYPTSRGKGSTDWLLLHKN